MQTQAILSALHAIRAPRTSSEYDLHALVREALVSAALPCQHEVPVAPRRRIDFLCGDVGIEVKRGRPMATPLLRQLSAYAQSSEIAALVLIAERLPALPNAICGKPLYAISLQRLWGVAL